MQFALCHSRLLFKEDCNQILRGLGVLCYLSVGVSRWRDCIVERVTVGSFWQVFLLPTSAPALQVLLNLEHVHTALYHFPILLI
jgi:hypothetical protein